jgi:hypothetical protein
LTGVFFFELVYKSASDDSGKALNATRSGNCIQGAKNVRLEKVSYFFRPWMRSAFDDSGEAANPALLSGLN